MNGDYIISFVLVGNIFINKGVNQYFVDMFLFMFIDMQLFVV